MLFAMHFPLISIIKPDVAKEAELGKTMNLGLGSLMTVQDVYPVIGVTFL